MIQKVKIAAISCTCDACGYRWVSVATKMPESCRNRACRSREWNGKKLLSHVMEIALPAPRKPGRPKTVLLLDGDEHF